MPTFNEIVELDNNYSFANKVCKSIGFRDWAKLLELDIKDSCSKLGNDHEEKAIDIIRKIGFEVEKMTVRHPYDLLINGCVKIDIKDASPRSYLHKTLVHTFATNKQNATCDLYILFALNELDEIEKSYIVPSVLAKVKTIEVNSRGKKYHEFLDRWDYIDTYCSFYKSIK